jgi:hypothetical protein
MVQHLAASWHIWRRQSLNGFSFLLAWGYDLVLSILSFSVTINDRMHRCNLASPQL